MPELRVSELTVEFRAGGEVTRPLNGFGMRTSPGSLVLLLGPSGSGKTTLLSCLAAFVSPAHGTIHFGDVAVSALAGKERTAFRRHTVGIVFQAFNLVPSLSATENVMAPLLAAGVGRAQAATRRRSFWNGSSCSTGPRIVPGSFPAVNSSGSPSPAPWCTIRRWSWPTSPLRTSTTLRWTVSCVCSQGSWTASE